MRASIFKLIFVAFLFPLNAFAQKPAGLSVMPEEFLRRWDPVTIFFAEAIGPAEGGPEDRPEKLVKISPDHPGAYTWVDAHTLIFKPAEPWPALARIQLTVRGKTFKRTTLMAAPLHLSPYDGETGLEPVESVAMTFPEPVPPEALAKMVRIELRPLPGAGEKEVRVLRREEFRIKTIDRENRAAAASYVIALGNMIPLGTRATVRFQLSLDDRRSDSFFETSFSTAEPFRVVSIGCRGRRYPVTPQGTKYQEDQAIRCSSDARAIEVELSTEPGALGPIEARNLVRVSPHVEKLELNTSGRILILSGDFDFDRAYRVSLHPVPLIDAKGRALDLQKPSEIHLYFPKRPSFLHVSHGHGMLERFGPKFIPLSGRGFTRLDLRIYPIDPFDLNFWPFGASPIAVDESLRPPGPGEEPELIDSFHSQLSPESIGAQIRALGAPPLFRIVDLPLGKTAGAASFGLDLAPHLQQLSGKNTPGHYLVGLRRLDGSNERVWMRVQVTDLSLSTLEGPGDAQFAVTRLSDGSPVANAKMIVEGVENGSHAVFFEGTTDKNGFARWTPEGSTGSVIRISVEHERDRLVLDANDAPEVFADNHWSSSEGQNWLGWATSGEEVEVRSPPQALCHLYTERPVYRPEDTVHFGGWARVREAGRIKNHFSGGSGFRLTITGPGNVQFNVPVELGELGGFHREFSEKELPTGQFTAHLSNPSHPEMTCDVRFRMEAYRIPTFEVRLNGPDQAPMDKDVSIKLTGSYYAGGPVSGQPVRWRVTQFPYTWSPPSAQPGFNYSTDARWSRRPRFESNAGLAKEDHLDETGAATLTLSPSMEPTAQPRTYIVEATVVGADEQTVTATHRTNAVPAFVLGLKVPRFLEHAKLIEPEIIAVAPKGELFSGAEVTVRLIQRAWHSHLLAGDFTEGNAKYITDVVEQKIREEKLITKADGAVKLSLPIPEAGVYIVELEARDKLGRAQVVAVDLYAGGERPLAWQKPSNGVFAVASDEPDYDPGETATLVLESPFKTARALAIVETPDGNQYSWVDVKGGTATFKVPVKANYVPRLPVHFVLMRGRVPSTPADEGQKLDLGKPATMAATKFITVNPVEHRVEVKLEYPKKAQPGQEITVELELSKKDRGGKKAVSGEVDLWLVDQAVLALGTEQPLDPLSAFITQVESRLGIRDTRGGVFGWLPLNETPGGDGDGSDSKNLLDRTTIRRKFSSVPFFAHAVKVGPNGKTTVKIRLPDNLTNFMVRAKAVSGEDRFGFATGQIAVRLPLVVQPALPRFVRAEDRVEGSAIARVVEGPGGAAITAVRIGGEGATLTRAPEAELTLKKESPARIDFSLAIGNPKKPAPDRDAEVIVTAGVERKSDRARDAVEVKLPIKPDIEPAKKREISTFDPKTPLKIAALPEEARPGTVKRTILISERDALIRMAAALDFMMDYPYGATEHRISRAHVFLAMEDFRKTLHLEDNKKFTERAIADALDWLPQVTDAQGFCSYWPGGQSYVSLTAWTVEFMTAAKKSGHAIDEKLYQRMLGALERALRSDYSRFIDGAAWYERVVSLRALAGAGRYQAGQAAELARKVEYLDLESIAGVSRVLSQNGQASSETVAGLDRELWDGVIVRLHQGREMFGGLQARHGAGPGMILPSETRTLAEISRALTAAGDRSPKLELLYDALVTLGRGDGWGTTNANASALLALSARLKPDGAAVKSAKITVRLPGGKTQQLELGSGAPVAYFETDAGGELILEAGSGATLTARVESEYIPVTGGKAARAEAQGFVVTRELLRIDPQGAAPEKLPLAEPGRKLSFGTGEVVEDHVEVVNQVARNYVAVVVPLAAGFDPLNPNLQTSPPESHPKGAITLKPTYSTYLDDQVVFYYDALPKGTYHFYFRVRATTPGSYTQPPAFAEMMYDRATRGRSAGANIEVARR